LKIKGHGSAVNRCHDGRVRRDDSRPTCKRPCRWSETEVSRGHSMYAKS